MYGRPALVGSGGSGPNQTSGRAERSAGVGTALGVGDGAATDARADADGEIVADSSGGAEEQDETAIATGDGAASRR